jgi:aminoglycoside phosphotransferase family enzyme
MTSQAKVIDAMMKPETYEEETGEIEFKQTHISHLFLNREFVYKIKKPVNFGFLDFSTLEKRKFYCEKELTLNQRLCGDMYLEVVPINKADLIKIKGKGITIEYAVKMRRIAEKTIMSNLLKENKIDKKIISEIAKIIAEFHSNTKSNNLSCKSDLWLTVDPIIEINWKENFDQTREFIGKTISTKDFNFLNERIKIFINKNIPIFKKRMIEGKVKNCHGDIHSGNIFIADKIYIFDAIEFNNRISYCDVTADIGFLAMDLDFKNNSDLSNILVENYVNYSGDHEVIRLLQFYKCYRAYVRGKVISFKLKDTNVHKEEKNAALNEAKAYFKLATDYAGQF